MAGSDDDVSWLSKTLSLQEMTPLQTLQEERNDSEVAITANCGIASCSSLSISICTSKMKHRDNNRGLEEDRSPLFRSEHLELMDEDESIYT